MAEDSDRLTFKCEACQADITIDEANPPNDDDMYCCPGCGREIATYGALKVALVDAAKTHVDKMFNDRFGKKPTWE